MHRAHELADGTLYIGFAFKVLYKYVVLHKNRII